MNLLTLTPAKFCEATEACAEGREFALQYDKMADVWEHCPKSDWLLWIAHKLGQKPDDRTLRLFAAWCVRNTPLEGGRVTGDLLTDPRSLAALEVAERYANGMATPEELIAAWAAARDAAWAAAEAARDAAEAAAWAAARDAAWDATRDATWAARDAAEAAARAAARDAARDAAWKAQAAQLRRMVPNPFRTDIDATRTKESQS